MLKKVIICVLIFASTMLGSSQCTLATDMNFFTEAIIPENQIDQSLTYFDLKMSPGQVQELQIKIKNTSENMSTIHVEPYTATTNQNGVIDYQTVPETQDSSLKYPITDLLVGEKVYQLEAGEEKKAVFKLTMPKEQIEGILLGGFKVYQEEKEPQKKQEKETTQIKNVFTRVIGIKLSEQTSTVKPDLQLNDIKPGLQNYRTVVTANLQNTMPVIVSGLSVEAKVRKKGNDDFMKEEKKAEMSMAPNSNFDFPINWKNQELESGKYILNLVAKDDVGNEWIFQKEFEIHPKEAKEYNSEAVELEKKSYLVEYILIGLVAAILIIVSLYLFSRHQKKKKKQQQRNKKKKANKKRRKR